MRLPVDRATYLAVETGIYTETLDRWYPRPAWLAIPASRTPDELEGCEIVRRGDDLFWHSAGGEETWLPPSRQVSAERVVRERSHRYAHLWERGHSAQETAEGEARADAPAGPEPTLAEMEAVIASGRYDVAQTLLGRYPGELPFYQYQTTPYIALLGQLGFQGMMTVFTDDPARAHRLLRGNLPRPSASRAAAFRLGARIAFVEECLSSADLISPAMYREFAFPYAEQTLEFYESRGIRTVFYFSGNLMPLLEDLRKLPFTALSFEEDRKGYGIDLAEVRRVIGPDRVLWGNVDAYFLEKASDDAVMEEVRRQVSVAGPARLALSCGSPFTPDTSLDRVRLFCESTRRL
jgi:hypothetical protein